MLTGADIHTFLLENGIEKSDTVSCAYLYALARCGGGRL